MPAGVVTSTVEGPNGEQFRVQHPNNLKDEEILSLAEAEFNRRQAKDQATKDAIKPINRSIGERFVGSAMDSLYNSPLVDEKVPSATPEEMSHPFQSAGQDVTNKDTLGQRVVNALPQSAEQIPLVGPFIGAAEKLYQGQAPEALGEFAASNVTNPPGLPATRMALGNAFKGGIESAKAVQPRWYEHPISAMVGAAAAHALHQPWYEGALGGAMVGGRTVPFARGFMRGLKEPVQIPAGIESVEGIPTGYNPYQDIPKEWAKNQIPNTADARTSPGTFHMGGEGNYSVDLNKAMEGIKAPVPIEGSAPKQIEGPSYEPLRTRGALPMPEAKGFKPVAKAEKAVTQEVKETPKPAEKPEAKKPDQVILMKAVKNEAKASGESLKDAVARLKKEGFIVRPDRSSRK